LDALSPFVLSKRSWENCINTAK